MWFSILALIWANIVPMSFSGKRVFVLGDSLSLYSKTPGGAFADALRAHGAQVTLNAKSGRSAASFFVGEDGRGILAAAGKPDIIYVLLGTNDIWMSNLQADARYMARIRDAFPASEVWAIGPPSFANPQTATGAARVVAMMKSVFPNFIDLRPLTPSTGRSPDGVHFTSAGGVELGKRLAAVAASSRGSLLPILAAVAVGVALWYVATRN